MPPCTLRRLSTTDASPAAHKRRRSRSRGDLAGLVEEHEHHELLQRHLAVAVLVDHLHHRRHLRLAERGVGAADGRGELRRRDRPLALLEGAGGAVAVAVVVVIVEVAVVIVEEACGGGGEGRW